MKRLRAFFNELLQTEKGIQDNFPSLKNLITPQEMLLYVQDIYTDTVNILKNNPQNPPQDKVVLLEWCQLFRKILLKAIKVGEPIEFSKFDGIGALSNIERKRMVNEVISKFSRIP